MKNETIVRLNLALLILVLGFVATGAWHLSAMSTKVDALWAVHAPHLASQPQPPKGNP